MAFLTGISGRCAALVLAMALTGAAAVAQAEDPALRLGQPTRLKLMIDADNPRQLWTAVMKTVGAYDKPQKCWTLEVGERRFCMRPAKLATVRLGDSNLYLFAVSGHEYEPGSLAGGVVMFLSFATSDYTKGLRSEGVDGLYEFGGRGAPPPDSAFRFVEAGPQTYAWEVADGFSGAALDVTTTTIIHAAGRFTPRRKVLAKFISYEGNRSVCGAQTDVPCSARRIDHAFRPGAGNLFALEMALTAKTGGEKIFAADDASPAIHSESVAISYDAATGQYKTPGQNMLDWLGLRPATRLAGKP